MELGFFDGEFINLEEPRVRLEDRGYQYGDGVYEYIQVYRGRCFALDRHLERWRRSMRELKIPITYMDVEIEAIISDLIKKSGITDGAVYFQVTRGTAPRAHQFPAKSEPHFSAVIRESKVPVDLQEQGINAVTCEDIRWLRCDIKSLNLLANCLAHQYATEKGVFEAIQYRKDTQHITEGSVSNFFIVKDGLIWTHPTNNLILKGVTRSLLLEKCAPSLSLTVVEKPFKLSFLRDVEEAFITATGYEVLPVVKIDGQPVADGKPGEVTKSLLKAYEELVAKECP